MKEVEASSDNVKTEENTISDEDLDEVATNVNLEDVTYSEDKVNIYFFWEVLVHTVRKNLSSLRK